ncbi:MAG: alpha/beta hydrolase [Desulfobacterales bacterium]|nr:alpha/beta hydrolase [Desulfobacterales bacterium]
MKSHLRFVNYGLAIIIFYIAFITSSYNLNIPFEQNAFASSSIGLSELKLYKGRVESTLWGPIEGAKVTAGAGWDIYSDITKKDGSYVTAYRFRGCPFFTYIAQVPVFIEMFYANFNPKTNFIGTFAETFYALDFCCGGDYTYLIGLEGGYGYAKECWDLEDEMTQKLAGIGYISVINVAILSGTATMDNVPREGIKYELSGPIAFVDKGKTEYQYDQIGLNHDIADRGLVKQISREDLEKTDICVYNLNDELITERQGIISKLEIKGEEKNASIYYNMYLRGPLTDSTEKVQNSAIGAFSDINDKDWNIYKHLKWDKIKIVAINRATGYIGTTICDINKDRNGSINIKPSQIFMRPPKLLISGVRIPKLESTLSKQVPKPYIIGFEGAGLTSDQTIAIRTYWNEDWNGNPLPKNLSGFTGRLAKVIAPNTLGKVSGKIEIAKGFEAGQIGQFEIKTGIHTQLVRLPEEEISKSHYYIHVNGEPPDRKPDFSSVGAGTGPLQYRPKHYVPIQVSVHDLSKGDEYIGVYRPEMQFSVFDLKEVTYEDKSGKKYDLIQPLPEKPVFGEDFNFIYTILKDELPVLNPFGPARELIFALGDQEIKVEYDECKGLKFNLDDIGKFSTEDLLALRLYQRNDENNILWEFGIVKLEIIPDWNRDGKIDDTDRDQVTKDKPWRFWANNDNDKNARENGIGASDDDRTGSGKDYEDYNVNGIRDLIDFFPVAIDLTSVIQLMPSSQGYTYSLKLSSGELKFFEGIYNSKLIDTFNIQDYLIDLDTAYYFSNKTVKTINALNADGVKFSEDFMKYLSSSIGIIYIEAAKVFTGDLELIVQKNGKNIGTFKFPLEISPVEDMFKLKDFRVATGAAPNDCLTDRPTAPKRPHCMNQEDKILVWVHGYNVSKTAAEGTFAEVFKRFFHQGYNGGFYGVTWNGTPPANSSNVGAPPHYHQTVFNSFFAAKLLSRFIKDIKGSDNKVYIAGHSMGNMVIGLAIQRDKMLFDKYFAIDAAVPLEAYGQTTSKVSMMKFNENKGANWLDYFIYRVNDTYPAKQVLPSEWYTLFDKKDRRSTLTWRNELKDVPTEKVYNFYSNTENVLREYSDDNFVWDDSGKPFDIDSYQMFSWVKQEKFKGRRDKIKFDLGGASSNYCGWSYNIHYQIWDANNGIYVNLTPAEAALISKEDLKRVPFFRLQLNDPNINELVADGDIPSKFLDRTISDTNLTNYYRDNQSVHRYVTVRDWLLAEAFPATTLPMGANLYSGLPIDNNINMSTKCKTKRTSTDWPRPYSIDSGNGDWWHSDYKDMPYVRVSDFYSKIKKLTD